MYDYIDSTQGVKKKYNYILQVRCEMTKYFF